MLQNAFYFLFLSTLFMSLYTCFASSSNDKAWYQLDNYSFSFTLQADRWLTVRIKLSSSSINREWNHLMISIWAGKLLIRRTML